MLWFGKRKKNIITLKFGYSEYYKMSMVIHGRDVEDMILQYYYQFFVCYKNEYRQIMRGRIFK